jgi:hypothetical protein
MHPLHHAISSARRFGGRPEDYLPIHQWFDESKEWLADVRHRAARHHTEGIFLAERIFGVAITTSSGRAVPVRAIGEQHVREDLGWIPSVVDWLSAIQMKPWMMRTGTPRAVQAALASAPAAPRRPRPRRSR